MGRHKIATGITVGVFAVGVLVVMLGLAEPARPVLFVGVGLCAVGSIGFQVFRSRRGRSLGAGRVTIRATRQSATSTAYNPVERLMADHPGRQLIWFLFVAAVATTVGVVAEVNARGNDRNVVGGIVFILFALVAMALAAYAYINWPYPARPDQSADQDKSA